MTDTWGGAQVLARMLLTVESKSDRSHQINTPGDEDVPAQVNGAVLKHMTVISRGT